MTKLPSLECALASLMEATQHVRTAYCAAVIGEAIRNIETAIRLEHDAHLREIRRHGT